MKAKATGGRRERQARVLLSPTLASRILFSPTGIRWLTKGLEAQTPQEVTHIALRLATLARFPSTAEQPSASSPLTTREWLEHRRRQQQLEAQP